MIAKQNWDVSEVLYLLQI